jgi:hypothetical protein
MNKEDRFIIASDRRERGDLVQIASVGQIAESKAITVF